MKIYLYYWRISKNQQTRTNYFLMKLKVIFFYLDFVNKDPGNSRFVNILDITNKLIHKFN